MVIFLAGFLFFLLAFGFPMFIMMFLPTVSALTIFHGHIPTFTLVQRAISGISPFPVVAVPLFIFAADIMTKGQMSQRLTNFAEKLVGHLTGGMAHATVLSSMIFGAVSGSTQATVAAVGSNVYPALLRRGYRESFVIGLIINASDVAQLIPPSIFFIIYGVITGTSIAALFMAGIIPGVLLGIGFMIYSWFWARKNEITRTPRSKLLDVLRATKEAFGPLGFVVIIIGGIYSGIFSPTEAAGAAVGYSLLIEILVYRIIKFKDIPQIALRSGTTTALVFILVGGAEAFAWLLTIARVPQMVTQALLALNPSPIAVLFMINLVFFIALMFFNPISAIIVLTPLFLPVTTALGIDPVHLGVLITLNAALGSATPPFGVDIFTACAIFRRPYQVVVKEVWPFIFVGVFVLLLLTFVPDLSLVLPRLLPH